MQQTPNHFWISLKEWSARVPQRWWDMINIPLSTIPFIVGIIAFLVWGRYTEPPLPLWIMLLVASGALLFMVLSFLAFDRVRVERDKARAKIVDNDIATVVEKLKAFKVTIGDKQLDAATILSGLQRQGKFTLGVHMYEVTDAITKVFRGSVTSEADSNASRSVFDNLSLWGLAQLEQRRTASGPHQYDVGYWILTDLSKKVIQHLESEEKPTSDKGASQN